MTGSPRRIPTEYYHARRRTRPSIRAYSLPANQTYMDVQTYKPQTPSRSNAMALFPSSQVFTMLLYPSVPRARSAPSARSILVADPAHGPIARWFNSAALAQVTNFLCSAGRPTLIHGQSSMRPQHPRKPTRKAYQSSPGGKLTSMITSLREVR